MPEPNKEGLEAIVKAHFGDDKFTKNSKEFKKIKIKKLKKE